VVDLRNDGLSTATTRRQHGPSRLNVLSQDTNCKDAATVAACSNVLGNLYPIRMPGEDSDSGGGDHVGFVSAMKVPTFACHLSTDVHSQQESRRSQLFHSSSSNREPAARGLEGVLHQGPAFVLDHVLSSSECRDIIKTCQQVGFGDYQAGKNHHGALQLLVSPSTADRLAQKLARHIDLNQVEQRRVESETFSIDNNNNNNKMHVELTYAGLNRRWRVYKYEADSEQTFAPHIDAGFPPSGLSEDGTELIWDVNNNDNESSNKIIVSRLTVLFYLNDDFAGGETKFYQPLSIQQQQHQQHNQKLQLIAAVRPKQGSCLVFPQGVGNDAVDYARQHWPLHEGAPVTAGSPKYVIRSDILFQSEETVVDDTDPLSRYDHLVRQTFLPQDAVVFHPNFLAMTATAYQPQMGVEHLGSFLYSFLRFTKKRRIVEIGAGYTSVWILQALADNEREMARVRQLEQSGRAKLLDYPWVVPAAAQTMDNHQDEPAKLVCIDNCQHQKETATGAVAIAQQLGLGEYLEFVVGDAYEIAQNYLLEPNSVDVLWCDFGVGTRARDFVAGAWPSLRPGGFLLFHSTLTNERTRIWLEAVRARRGEDETGMPPGEYVEVSLLEPHKQFQNSISVLQKRKGYSEPLYSEYA